MKSYKHLVKAALSDAEMDAALASAARGKLHRRGVREVLENKEEVKARIRGWVVTRDYPELIHRAMTVIGGANRKERTIAPPYFTPDCPEHWMHHVLVRAIGGILLRGVYFHSYAAIPGRGVHKAKRYIERFIRRNPRSVRYFLKLDIRKFYRSIPVDRLKAKLARVIRDKYIYGMADWVLDQNRVILPSGEPEACGLPLGFYTSQFFANFYLQELDHFVSEKLRLSFFLRYMDDLLMFSPNRRRLASAGEKVSEWLAANGLTLKNSPQVRDFAKTPLNFIGFKFLRDRTLMRKPVYVRAMRLARQMGKKLPALASCDAESMVSYLGWFSVTHTRRAWARWVSPNVNIAQCRSLISLNSKKLQTKTQKTL